MDFEMTERAKDVRERLLAFMDEHVYAAEPVYAQQLRAAGTPHAHPPIMETLKAEAHRQGLWNLFLPDEEHGVGLTTVEYAPLAEIMGRTRIAPEACNCSAPDTGNMEVLHDFGTAEQQQRWLRPLLDGEIRSGFAMTEPAVASSDATNIAMRIERDGDETLRRRQVVDDRRAASQLPDPDHDGQDRPAGRAPPATVDGPRSARHARGHGRAQHDGVRLHRPEGHGVLRYEDVRVPVENIIAGEGMGFLIAQERLGPGRVHHCMRAIGAAKRRPGAHVRPRRRARDVRPPGLPQRQRTRLDRGIAHRDRDGPAAGH